MHIYTTPNADIPLTSHIAQIGLDRRRKRPTVFDPIDDHEDEDEDDGISEVEISPGVKHRVQPSVYLALLPIMLGSRLCRLQGLPNERLIELGEPIYEPGGYFLLRGKERVIIPQKNLGKNTLFITRDGDEVTGTLHACMESVDAARVVNKITIGYTQTNVFFCLVLTLLPTDTIRTYMILSPEYMSIRFTHRKESRLRLCSLSSE